MKKTAILLLALLFCLLPACAPDAPDDGRLSIVASTFPGYDFARAVAGDLASVTMLIQPGTETHSYDPSPKDIRRIRECDIFIYGGGESDAWMDSILDAIDTDRVQILAMTELVPTLAEEELPGAEHDHDHDHEEDEIDEHVWTSLSNAAAITEAVCAAAMKVDAEHADAYRANADAYIAEIRALEADFRSLTESAARKTVIFADRFPFLYFVREFGLDYYAAFPGCAEETEPSAQTIAQLIDRVKAEAIPAVFYTEFSSQNLADAICEAAGAQKLLFHSCHNVSRTDFEAGETYVSLMRNNLINLRGALN